MTVSKDGFEPLDKSVSCDSTATTTEFEIHNDSKLERTDRVEVQASASCGREQNILNATN